MDKDGELRQVNTLKTVMMFFVVLYHSLLASCQNGWGGINYPLHGSTFVQYIAAWLNMFHTQTFAFASGYLFYMLRYELGRYRTPQMDIKKRFKRLMVPFIVVSIFWALPAQLLAYGFSWDIILKGFILQSAPAQLWFLPMLFYLFIIFYLFSDHFVKLPVWEILLLYAVLYVGKIWIGKYIPLGLFQISSTIEYSLYYYLGFIFRRNKIQTLPAKQVASFCFAAGILAVGYIYLTTGRASNFTLDVIRPVVCSVQIYAAVGIGKAFQIECLANKKWFNRFSVNSMGIYLFHQQILYLMMRVLCGLPKILFVPLSFSIALAFSNFLTIVLKKSNIGRAIVGA